MISCTYRKQGRNDNRGEIDQGRSVLTVFSEEFDCSTLFNILAGLVSMHEQLIRKGGGLSWPGVCNA